MRDRGVSKIGGPNSDNLNVQIPEAAMKKNHEMPREQRNTKEERKSDEGSSPKSTKILHAYGFVIGYTTSNLSRNTMNALFGRVNFFGKGTLFCCRHVVAGAKHESSEAQTPLHANSDAQWTSGNGCDLISDDNFDQQATHLHERMLVKISAVVTKTYNRERMRPITRYDGAIFLLTDKEALNIWLWHAQKIWNEHFGNFVEKEKSYRAGTYGMSNLSGRDPELGQSSMESGISLGEGPSHRAISRFK